MVSLTKANLLTGVIRFFILTEKSVRRKEKVVMLHKEINIPLAEHWKFDKVAQIFDVCVQATPEY